jgi:glyoxylase-like metal-dependent hydrolase (beta-lactamase superfamily II)
MPEEIVKDIYRIEIPLPGNPLKAVNSYVVKGRRRSLVIDTGMRRKECMDVMRSGLDSLDIDLNTTDFFITHFHADHLGLVSELATEDAKVYLNRIEARLTLSGGFGEAQRNARLQGFPEAELQHAVDGHPGSKYGPRLPLVFTETHDGQTIEVAGYTFQCVETPGHSFSHTCLYEGRHKILVSGDHVLLDITPNIQAWADNWNPLEEYLRSLERTARLDVDLVLPGHRTVFVDLTARTEELREHHERREEEVLLILGDKEQTAYEVASEMTWDIPYESFPLFPLSQRWFATGEAVAHLVHLLGLGKVHRKTVDVQGKALVFWSLPNKSH